MKYIIIIGLVLLLANACIREKYDADECRSQIDFVMLDVPYIFDGEEATGYGPYYNFTRQLELFVFSGQRLAASTRYNYQYCRDHRVIPYVTDYGEQYFLFVSNLYDPKELDWSFLDDSLKVVFRIVGNEEPPVLLADVVRATVDGADSIRVGLKMLVSHIEIRVENPPLWVTGLDVNVSNVAAAVTPELELSDTTHIFQQVRLDNQGPGTYVSGINTFPTYPGQTALLNIRLIGKQGVAPIIVDDDRLRLQPGVITRLNIRFETEEDIRVSVEVLGKWEIADEGHIII